MYRKLVADWGFDFKAPRTARFQAKSYKSPTLNAEDILLAWGTTVGQHVADTPKTNPGFSSVNCICRSTQLSQAEVKSVYSRQSR